MSATHYSYSSFIFIHQKQQAARTFVFVFFFVFFYFKYNLLIFYFSRFFVYLIYYLGPKRLFHFSVISFLLLLILFGVLCVVCGLWCVVCGVRFVYRRKPCKFRTQKLWECSKHFLYDIILHITAFINGTVHIHNWV